MSAAPAGVRTARVVGAGLALVVVIVAAIYVVVDLARWEWNRAVLSALICIAALIVFSSAVIVGHLTRLEQRMEAAPPARGLPPSVAATSTVSGPVSAARPRFAWLETPERDRGVFVPVLLGAGVVLSFIAYLVERVSAAVSSGAVDAATMRQLAADLPLGDGAVHAPALLRRRPRSMRRRLLGALLAVVAVAGIVEGLRQLTQTRPGEITAVGSTTVVVAVQQRRIVQPPESVLLDLWGACRSRLGAGVSIRSIEVLGGEVVRIEIDRALGETGRRRLVGCLEDHTLDLVRADVVALHAQAASESRAP